MMPPAMMHKNRNHQNCSVDHDAAQPSFEGAGNI